MTAARDPITAPPPPKAATPSQPHRHQRRGGRADRAPAPELPLRASTDRDVPQALPRRRDLLLWGVADPGPAGARPAAGQPALQAPTQRPKRYEKQRPGHRVQIDVKFIAPIDGVTAKRHYQFTAIDDCTRLRVLRIYPEPTNAPRSPSSTTSPSGSHSLSRSSRPTFIVSGGSIVLSGFSWLRSVGRVRRLPNSARRVVPSSSLATRALPMR